MSEEPGQQGSSSCWLARRTVLSEPNSCPSRCRKRDGHASSRAGSLRGPFAINNKFESKVPKIWICKGGHWASHPFERNQGLVPLCRVSSRERLGTFSFWKTCLDEIEWYPGMFCLLITHTVQMYYLSNFVKCTDPDAVC